MYYNPEYVVELDDDLVQSAMAHETMHIVLGHILRHRGHYLPKLANIAADIVVNALLRKDGFKLHPQWIVVDESDTFKFEGKGQVKYEITDCSEKSVEEVYEELLSKMTDDQKNEAGEGSGDGSGEGSGGEGSGQSEVSGVGKTQDGHKFEESSGSGSGGDGESEEKDGAAKFNRFGDVSDEWKFKATEAAAVARQMGKLPGHIAKVIGELIEPKVDWRDQLADFITKKIPMNRTWRRYSRLSRAIGTPLPSKDKNEEVEFILHIDLSGSISNDIVRTFMSELQGIFSSYANVSGVMLPFDMVLDDEDVLDMNEKDLDEIIEHVESLNKGGGTSHAPAVEWINENAPEARLFISLTDGFSDIESCYEGLPDGCARLIVLASTTGSVAESLEDYGHVINLDNY